MRNGLSRDSAVGAQVRQDFLEKFEKDYQPDQVAACSLLYNNATTLLHIKWRREDALKSIRVSDILCDDLPGHRVNWD